MLLQTPGTTQDGNGEIVSAWSTSATVWASIDDISGREYVAANADQNSVQTKITIRYRAGIVPKMRVLHGAIAYDIESVLEQGRDALLLMCRKAAS